MIKKIDGYRHFVFGRTVNAPEGLSAAEARKLVETAEKIRDRETPPAQERILDVFARASEAWSYPHYHARQKAIGALSKSSGLGRALLEAVFEEFPKIFSREYLLKKIEGELGSANIQETAVTRKKGDPKVIAHPAGCVLHVASGNVFLGSVESLIDGIITKNVNFLKMSSEERTFPAIFAESIREFDARGVITKRLAVLWWPGGREGVENIFKKSMDRIIFWGGAEAISSWEKSLGDSTVLVRHGPKVSFGAVSKKGLESSTLADLTDRIAFDVSIWEQKACNSPQTIFMQDNVTPKELDAFLDSLGKSFEKMNLRFPPGERSGDECVEVLRTRELALAKHLKTNEPVKISGPENFDWTIICEERSRDRSLTMSPLNRTIIIRRYASASKLASSLKIHSRYLQTAGFCLHPSELDEYTRLLSAIGVTRLCRFGAMALAAPGTPHDGTYALRDLTKFTAVEA